MTTRIQPFAWGGLLLLVTSFSACSALVSDEPPASDSTLVEVLIEFHLARARLNVRSDLSPAMRDSILSRHGLDEQSYEEMTTYYVEHPQAYADLYRHMLDRLSEERATQRQGLLESLPPP